MSFRSCCLVLRPLPRQPDSISILPSLGGYTPLPDHRRNTLMIWSPTCPFFVGVKITFILSITNQPPPPACDKSARRVNQAGGHCLLPRLSPALKKHPSEICLRIAGCKFWRKQGKGGRKA
ncbi:Hypothetical predicted protein [Podarcis lilfordi]|uniref:Uncharacterized protein n=1 Tax=Podarcis lilfordi TaxID=74358 RepID=A0AA35LLN2_9SAUR|nr:Hypothetical predicted protein [Podarcis lilfordi]